MYPLNWSNINLCSNRVINRTWQIDFKIYIKDQVAKISQDFYKKRWEGKKRREEKVCPTKHRDFF